MSRGIAKNTALRAARSLARRAGFSERQYEVRARAGAGVCELWLRRKVGPCHGLPVRAELLRLGNGPSWAVAAASAARMLGGDVRRAA